MSHLFLKAALLLSSFGCLACKKHTAIYAWGNEGGDGADSVKAVAPPATWKEHWFDHTQTIYNTYYDTSIAIYYDADVPKNITWPNKFFGEVWEYTKKVYGGFGYAGKDNRLFCIFHQGRYGGGHPATFFDASHDNRNVIDCGAGPWTSFDYNTVAIPTHEVGHIVEGGSKGIKGSPAFPVWGDSKWMEIYIYDVYKGLGYNDFAQQWHNEMQTKSDNFPVANTQWYKNWFYPIYSKYGGTAVLNKFFEMLAAHFPTKINAQGQKEYSRDMNLGEFVHFWSGAAGASLKDQATTAFTWTTSLNTQYNQAVKDFADIKY